MHKGLWILTSWRAALLALALASSGAVSAKPTLNVYTYDSFASKYGPGPKIKANFEKVCGCVLNWVAVDSSAGILSRVQMDGASSNADVVLGLDLNLMGRARQTGLLAESGVDTSVVNLPAGWSDPVFVPFDHGYFAFIYDATKLANPPRSLQEVVDNPKLRVIYQDPRTSTPGLGLLLWMKAVFGDEAAQAWAKLAAHTVTVTKSWYEGYSLFLKGEADVVLSYTTSPAYHVVAEGKTQYRAAPASEGYYPQVEVAAMLKSASNRALAQQFLRFLLEPGFQAEVATGNWMYPVVDQAQPLPAAFAELAKPTRVLMLPEQQVRVNRRAWVAEWLEATTR
jgi:thiamine transport system substrate-binding protein